VKKQVPPARDSVDSPARVGHTSSFRGVTQYAGGDKPPGRIAPNALRNLPPPFIRRNTLGLLRPTRARLCIGSSKASPESIADCFSGLTLEQIYGTITYYLGHRAEIDAYLKAADDEYEAFRQRVRAEYPRLSRKLDEMLEPTQHSVHENPVSG
jgi:hypothetical protein